MGGGAAVTATTVGAQHDSKVLCNITSVQPDLVYRFTTAQPKKVTALLTPNVSTYKVAVYLRSSCGSLAAADQVDCGIGSGNGAAKSLTVPNLPAGTYWVWVDGAYSTNTMSGPFTLRVTLEDP